MPTEKEPLPVTPARSSFGDGCLRSLRGRATCRQDGARCAGPFTRADTAAGARGVHPVPVGVSVTPAVILLARVCVLCQAGPRNSARAGASQG